VIEADEFLIAAATREHGFLTGVPCSFLTPVINRAASLPALTYVGAASEGEAVAIAAGAWLGGRGTVVMCQNSGLGNAVNPLTSLNAPFRIPTLMVTTWRGQPGRPDEPQHEVMGRITGDLLTLCGVAHAPFPSETADIAPALDTAMDAMARTCLPYAFVMSEGAVRSGALDEPPRRRGMVDDHAIDLTEAGPRPTRAGLLERLLAILPPQAAVIATTGKAGRELFTLADRDQHLYQVGSMGGASAMGLGVALTVPRRVVVLDGDGAALMKLGNLATIGAYAPANLLHILLDNGVHDSTGGQATSAPVVEFAAVALACGYRSAWSCDTVPGFSEAVRAALAAPGPCLVHARMRPGSMARLGRPTVAPHEVARRFRAFLAQSAA
jgi:phosphonopyruvate decarboxylase